MAMPENTLTTFLRVDPLWPSVAFYRLAVAAVGADFTLDHHFLLSLNGLWEDISADGRTSFGKGQSRVIGYPGPGFCKRFR